MKVLFLASRHPYPTTKGDQLRVANFLEQLVKQGHQVDFICSTETSLGIEQHWTDFPQILNKIIVCGYGRVERYFNLIKPFFTLQPFQVAYFYNRQMQYQVDQAIRQTDYDVIICQMVRTAPYVTHLKQVKILDFQDAYSLNMYKRYMSETGLVKWVSWLEWHLLAKYEKRLLKKFSKTMIISHRDKEVIGHRAIEVINNGVSAETSSAPTIPHQIVFSGNLQYFPNREAIVWFATQVFPLIRQQQPQAQLKITGATPPPDVVQLQDNAGVVVVANPVNMFQEISTASVAVAPMLSGSGMQNKVLEAMAVGVPVVLTQHALEGLESSALQAVKLSPIEAQAMADSIIELISQPSQQQLLRQQGLNYIRQHHSWDKVGQQLDQLIRA